MDRESYAYLKAKINSYENIDACILRHLKALDYYNKRPDRPVGISVDNVTYYITLSDELKQKAIDLLKEQLEMYEQKIKGL